MTTVTRLAVVGATVCAASAHAQFDPSVWPGFRGTGDKRAAVLAEGPAVNHAFTLTSLANVSPGGFTIAANGDIYFKTYKLAGSSVYRLDPADGSVLAQSVDLGGVLGNYAGVAVGVDALYTCIYEGVGTTRIVKLDKLTLAVISTFTNPAFQGLRGTPLISDVVNNNGNHNLFIADRNGQAIYAVDSVTGSLEWTYVPIYDVVLGQMGPMWTVAGGRQAFAYFGNGDLGPGAALADNGNGTFDVLWEAAGPDNFNWFGSGALSTDQTRIYITTFNDNFTSTLWAIDVNDGSIIWDVPGLRGSPNELNFFARPAVLADRVYCFGQDGVIAAFDDNGPSYTTAWIYRDMIAEFTSGSVVRTPAGDTFVYAVRQDPPGLVVLKDEGASFTTLLDTNLGGAMRWTFLAASSTTIDSSGGLWIAGGRVDDPLPGDVYKFTPEPACPCACDFDPDPVCDIFDFLAFQNLFVVGDPCACDIDPDPACDIFDFLAFQNQFVMGCP
ncbi:MAG: PQQ-like beta-propeller repeat protein [Planctomycetes bacterium]|nr:PQQ-like beta-propeller repeat protein [Planctomycetota bacterium]